MEGPACVQSCFFLFYFCQKQFIQKVLRPLIKKYQELVLAPLDELYTSKGGTLTEMFFLFVFFAKNNLFKKY